MLSVIKYEKNNIIDISATAESWDNNTANKIKIFFFDVFVTFETYKISFINGLNFFNLLNYKIK